LKNIRIAEGSLTFIDVYTLAIDLDTAKMDKLRLLNNTDHYRDGNGAYCCWEDHNSVTGSGLKHWLNGLARVMKYTKNNNYGNMELEEIWEGQIIEGVQKGFGRLMDGQMGNNFIGFL